MLEFLFSKVAGLKACNFIKKRFQHRCFPLKFAKFLRISIFTRTPIFPWLLLNNLHFLRKQPWWSPFSYICKSCKFTKTKDPIKNIYFTISSPFVKQPKVTAFRVIYFVSIYLEPFKNIFEVLCVLTFENWIASWHCITVWNVSKYGDFSGPYFSPNAGKYGPEKTLYLDTFHAVYIIYICITKVWDHLCYGIPFLVSLLIQKINVFLYGLFGCGSKRYWNEVLYRSSDLLCIYVNVLFENFSKLENKKNPT